MYYFCIYITDIGRNSKYYINPSKRARIYTTNKYVNVYICNNSWTNSVSKKASEPNFTWELLRDCLSGHDRDRLSVFLFLNNGNIHYLPATVNHFKQRGRPAVAPSRAVYPVLVYGVQWPCVLPKIFFHSININRMILIFPFCPVRFEFQLKCYPPYDNIDFILRVVGGEPITKRIRTI